MNLNRTLLYTFTISLLLVSCSGNKQKNETREEPANTLQVGQILTPMGEIIFKFYEETPVHKASFIELANGNYWDSLTFNRVIPDFVAQGGCPDTPAGFSDSPYLLEPEFTPVARHVYGAVGAGRDGNAEKLSAGCQFYIVQNKEGEHRLDDNYTVFGQVIKGMDVIDAIVNVERDTLDEPLTPITLDVNVIEYTEEQLRELGVEL